MLGGREQTRQFDERWDLGWSAIREKRTSFAIGEAQCTLPRLVIDQKQIVDLLHGPRSLPLAFRAAALGTTHKHASPAVRRGVADCAEECAIGGSMKRAGAELQCRVEREAI